MGVAKCQIVNITEKLLALGRSNDAKTQLNRRTVVTYPFAFHLKLKTADMSLSFRLDYQLILGIGLDFRHTGTFQTAPGNTDIPEQTFAFRNPGNLRMGQTSVAWTPSAVQHTPIINYLHNMVNKYILKK